DVTNLETLTTIALNADDTNIDYIDEDGNTTKIDLTSAVKNLETISTLVDHGNGSFTYTNENGSPVTFQASTITDNGNGTSTIGLADGGNITVDNDGIDDVDDADAIIGNEVVNGTDATLTRSGSGTNADPYTLDIAADGITNAEIADDAVQLENIANGTSTGQVMQWDGTDWILIDLGSVTVTENDGVIGNEVTGATDGTLTLSGAGTTVSPYTLDVAADGITNAELAYNAVGLENITDGTAVGELIQWNGTDWVFVDASTLDTDTQDLSIDAAGTTISLVDGGSVTINPDDADADPTNEYNTGISFDGTNLTVTDGGGNRSVDISALGADTNTTNTSLTQDGTNLILTDSDTNTVSIPLSDIGTDDQDLMFSGNEISLTGDPDNTTIDLTPYVNDDTNELTDLSLTGNVLTLTNPATGTNSVTLPTADGSETIVNGGTDISVTGTGTSTDPYVVNSTFTEVDGSITNEIQDLDLTGDILKITNNGSATDIDLSGYTNTDNQDLTISGNVLSLTGDATSVTLPTADGTETVVTAGTDIGVSGDGSSATPYVITNTFTEVDGSITNEIQDASEVEVTPAGNITSMDVQAALEELDADILSSEKTTTVVEGTGIDVSTSISGNNTEYTVTVDPTDIVGDGSITSSEIDVTGGANATLNDVTLTIADNAITNAKMADDAITTAELATGAVESSDILDGTIVTADIANDAVALEKLANGTALGQVMQWDGSDWTLVDLGSVTVTENDGVIGNEVTGATNGTLALSGAGTTVSPYTLAVATDGITTNEIATGAVESSDILDGTIATGDIANDAITLGKLAAGSASGDLIQWNGTDWVFVDASTLDTNTTNTSLTQDGTNLILTDSDTNTVSIPLADIGTDDQDLQFSANVISLTGDPDNTTIDLTPYVNDDTNELTDLSLTGNVLTLTNPATGTNSVTLPTADGSETIVNGGTDISVTGTGTSTDPYVVNSTFTEVDGSTTNEVNTSFAVNAGNLEITDSNGTLSVPLSSLGTDDQTVDALTFDSGTGELAISLEGDGAAPVTVNLSALDTNTTNTSLTEDGTNLILTDSDTNTVSIPLADLGSDDQTASEVSYDNTASGLTAGDTQTAIDELAAGSTDDQNLTGATLTGNSLQIDIEGGSSTSVDLSSLVGTDDQIANEVNITDTAGNFAATEVEGALAELAEDILSSEKTTTVVEGTGVDVSSTTSGNNTEYTVAVNVSELTGDGSITSPNSTITLGGTPANSLLENVTLDVNESSLADGSITSPNSTITLGGTPANAIFEDVTLDVDVTALTGDGSITSTDLTVSGGANATLNDVTLTIADNVITNAKMADDAITTAELATGAVESSDILDGTIATGDIANDAVALEKLANGTALGQVMQWDGSDWTLVDLGSVTVTENDGVIGNEVTGATNGTLALSGAGTTVSPYTLAVATDGITNAEIADDAVQLENIADGTTAGELIQWNGTDWVLVDASTLDTNTTNTSLTQDGTNLILTDSDTNMVSIPLADLGSDDQTASEVTYDNTTSGLTAGNTQAAIDELAAGSTDDQQLDDTNTAFNTSTNELTIALENGGTATADLSALDNSGTDDQTASEVTYDNTTSGLTAVDTQAAIDELAAGSTDDQALSLSGNTLTLEDGGNVDLSAYLDDTDDQTLSLSGNTLSIADGNSVDLSGYVSTDDQTASEVTYDNTASGLTAVDTQAAIDELAAGSTDDQQLDDTNTAFNTSTNELTIALENGGTATADLSALDNSGTDDQTASEVTYDNTTSGLTAVDTQAAIDELAAGSTDDQALSLSGNTLTLEDGGNVDLSAYLDDTDDQTLSLSGNTLSIADGNSVDLSG
ncbi:beta strand repeat-containing protein, partial [Maribacter polysaccharolyticus]|uniref:beta strand repeat-containing protein n=1 Tax=Maribacter polysaccharolyticus TaxID=3020831 RepID=UPI00237FB39F